MENHPHMYRPESLSHPVQYKLNSGYMFCCPKSICCASECPEFVDCGGKLDTIEEFAIRSDELLSLIVTDPVERMAIEVHE